MNPCVICRPGLYEAEATSEVDWWDRTRAEYITITITILQLHIRVQTQLVTQQHQQPASSMWVEHAAKHSSTSRFASPTNPAQESDAATRGAGKLFCA